MTEKLRNCLVLAIATTYAADNPLPAQFRADATMILVPVTVTDRRGAPVNGLPASSFSLTEDNTPRKIASFSQQDVPCSVAVIFDLSGSMASKRLIAIRFMRPKGSDFSSEPDHSGLPINAGYRCSARRGVIIQRRTPAGSDPDRLLSAKCHNPLSGATRRRPNRLRRDERSLCLAEDSGRFDQLAVLRSFAVQGQRRWNAGKRIRCQRRRLFPTECL